MVRAAQSVLFTSNFGNNCSIQIYVYISFSLRKVSASSVNGLPHLHGFRHRDVAQLCFQSSFYK
ncbi:hypothetical protein Plhal304r1_c028g0093101 [Plasmopara halstedii]